MTRRNRILVNIDWLTIILYLILVLLGWINIYAAVYDEEYNGILNFSQRYGKQFIWIIAALIIGIVTLIIDSRFYVVFSYPIYGLFIFFLIIVLFIGTEINGSKSWLVISGFRFQPAEFAKFATALGLAKFVSTYNFKLNKFKSWIIIILLLIFPALLIFLQNDTGSALVYSVFIIVLYREGLSGVVLFFMFMIGLLFVFSLILSNLILIFGLIIILLLAYIFLSKRSKDFWKIPAVIILCVAITWGGSEVMNLGFDNVIILIAGSVISSLIFLSVAIKKRLYNSIFLILIFLGSLLFTLSVDYVFENVLVSHQQDRINELLGIKSDPLGAGYNVNQSKIAIGSGGVTGKGFLKGTQTKFNFVPEQSTDFIFCTVGEEWGFIGTSVVIVLFLVLFSRLIFLAERQRSVFSRVYGYSVTSILFFHFMVNIGMTIGLMPVIGIPLPFISYGGSSLWSFTILISIFLRLDATRLEVLS